MTSKSHYLWMNIPAEVRNNELIKKELFGPQKT